MKLQTKWGIEVEARRWWECPHCGEEIEVSPLATDGHETTCPSCGKSVLYSDVKHGRLHWIFTGEVSGELTEQIVQELEESAKEWGAHFTVERSDEPPQPCTGCGEIDGCRCAELDDSGHMLNISTEDLENEA